MTAQSTAAAERSAHVVREAGAEATCAVCGGPFRGNCSHAARILGNRLRQVCSAACAQDQRWTDG
ncbi:hypothetical protein [Falsiroseomonas tokyonensis]|uniref:Uncharacterized protein n=1 Tax=Falsiroseomonas tokyonensis TaxID=430521 RepID=A0ABV7C1M5_9PROT|nr:hypothetical protein [Falsiroseomonas tokyonensis]MBU8540206.1 hypothetical protein [Falsiroseomonas tokyonensis]